MLGDLEDAEPGVYSLRHSRWKDGGKVQIFVEVKLIT
jgi:hypothetical protein